MKKTGEMVQVEPAIKPLGQKGGHALRGFFGSGGGIRTRDLRVMSRFRGVGYLLICRDFVKLRPVP